jgi:hypothetical protein
MLVGVPALIFGPPLGFPKIGRLSVSVELHLARRYLLGLRRRTHNPVRDRDQGHPRKGDTD